MGKREMINYYISLVVILFFSNMPVFAASSFQTQVINNIKNYNTSFDVKYNRDIDDFKNEISVLMDKTIEQDPIIANFISEMGYEASGYANDLTVHFDVSYRTNSTEEAYTDAFIEKEFNNIIKAGMSDYEKVKSIHDFVVNKFEYDYNLKNESPYDGLVSGTTVCNGYTFMIYKLLNKAGIKNAVVNGYIATPSKAHTWNMVELNNNWYNIDATNDDTTKNGYISYKFFMVSDSTMKLNNYVATISHPESVNNYNNLGVVTKKADIQLKVFNKEIVSENKPRNIGGRILVPVRMIAENFGSVSWDGKTQSINIVGNNNGNKFFITMKVDDKTIVSNNVQKSIDVAPQIINGSTYVPIRFISEEFGMNVNWDNANKIVNIY